jgi:hypothetical protein
MLWRYVQLQRLFDPGLGLADICQHVHHGIFFPERMLPLTARLTIPLDVWFTFALCTKLLNAVVRYVNSGSVGKSGILRGFKDVKHVQNPIAGGPFGF